MAFLNRASKLGLRHGSAAGERSPARSDRARCPDGRRRRATMLPVVAALIAACLPATGAAAAPPEFSEYQVKAAFLYNFAKFVEWPADAFADSSAALIIGVVGDDPFGAALDKTVLGKTVRGRRLEIARYAGIRDIQHCHILFVAASEERQLAAILHKVGSSHVLTVGETRDFAASGGIVNFVVTNYRVGFQINVAAAQRARLRISSRLLRLAEIIDAE